MTNKPISWWRGLFFRLSLAHVDPDPLPVEWPAGDYVITIEMGASMVFWGFGGSCTGVSKRPVIELRATLTHPPRAFAWPLAPQDAVIRSVKVDGLEQIVQAPKAGLVGAVFERQYFIEAKRRAWWAWIPWLWERRRGDEYDD